ncbi:pleckstrin homology domain-containing family J member 1 isoform X1 [Callithrix jacchus]
MRYNEKELQALSRQPAEMAAELGMRGPKKGSVLKRRLVKLVVNFLFYFRTDEAEPVGALLLERCRVTREEPGTFSISECGWGGQGRLQQPGAPAAPHCPLPRRPRPPLCPQPGATLPRHKSALSTASSRLRRGPREEVSLRVQQRGAVSGVDGGSPLGQLRVHAEKPHLLQERNPEGDRQGPPGAVRHIRGGQVPAEWLTGMSAGHGGWRAAGWDWPLPSPESLGHAWIFFFFFFFFLSQGLTVAQACVQWRRSSP